MADYGQLDDFGDLTVEQIRDMKVSEFAQLRSHMLTVREITARDKRDSAFRKQEDFAAWKTARELYAHTGSDFSMQELLSHVRLDEERYDDE